ncbi:MAG: LysR family transcriptional regulator [Bacteroidetes bacterium]|nr:LysR family transcriptional regulator [Bacteroidota bacterium]
MNFTLHQLQVFCAIAKEKSITKASEILSITQPAVSIQLKNFQQQFDIPLTEVIGRQIFITDFGNEIAEAAESILAEVKAIDYKTMAYKGHVSGKLKVSVVSTGKYVMPYLLHDFMNLHAAVDLEMDVTNRGSVITSIEKNEVDFSLVSILPDNLPVNHLELMSNRLYLVGNSEKNFKAKQYGNEVFKNLSLIFRETGSGTRMAMEDYLTKNNVEYKQSMTLTSNEAVKQAVMAGLGYSIMPIIGIRNELEMQQLQIIPTKGFPITSTWYLVWHKNKNLSPVAQTYLDYVSSNKKSLISDHFSWINSI